MANAPGKEASAGLASLISVRLRLALTTLPSARNWLEGALLLLSISPLLLVLGGNGGFFALTQCRTSSDGQLGLALLALRVLVAPALLEEMLFRAALNPHPSEGAKGGNRVKAAGYSLLAYLILHPLAGTVFPALKPVFLDPLFLACVVILGAVCLFSYLRSGSIWLPVVIHSLVVLIWLSCGGQGVLPV